MTRTSRKDAPDHLKFDLTVLYPSREAWLQDVGVFQENLKNLQACQGHVTEHAASLFETLHWMEQLGNHCDKVRQYAHALSMADASDSDAQKAADQAEHADQQLQMVLTATRAELYELSEVQLTAYIQEEPQLKRYENYLNVLLANKSHQLSADAEAVLTGLQVSVDGPNRLYGILTNADLECRPIERSDGTHEAVAIDTYLFKLSADADRTVRRAAYESITDGLKSYEHTLVTNYLTHVKTQAAIAKLRNYTSAAEMFLADDGIPVDFYHMALDVIMEEAKPVARRYLALQKQVQGVDKLHFYDLVAPLDTTRPALSYAEGQAFIEAGLRPLGDGYARHLHAAFEERRIDLADNYGKFPIPVTMTSYGAPTYILSTWYDLLSDAMVLGHELGHLVHTDLTRAQNRFDADYGMLLAETASTTNEWMLFHHLQKSGDSAQVLSAARYLMEFDFVQLIGMSFVIEKMQAEVYRRVETGQSVAVSDVSTILTGYLKELYGEDLEVGPLDGLFWMMWPQPMYATLYPYCYAAALCMSGAIVEAIQTEGQPAIDRYLTFLQSGGSKPTPETYAIAGVDMMNPETLRKGIRRFGNVLEALEA